MTAGRGIVNSERMRAPGGRGIYGVQTWVALPRSMEEDPPSFEHYGPDAVPTVADGEVTARVIAGSWLGATSRVRTSPALFYAEAQLEAGAVLQLTPEHEERAVFVASGAITVGATPIAEGEIAPVSYP